MTGRNSKLVGVLLALLIAVSVRAAEPFAFVALGDTAYNGERDYPIYRRLIAAINAAAPAFTIHVGDVWGANVAWLRDSFRIAREGDYAAIVVALHAEMFEERGIARPAFADMVEELKLGAERFRKPVLLINGDTHEFVVDRPLFEPRGEADAPFFANVTRLEVYGAPEIRALRVGVDTSTPWVFSFSPLYVD